MKRLRILALMHEDLVPPEDTTGVETTTAEWKMEYDVTVTLRELGHEVRSLGLRAELSPLREALESFQPHVVFNLLEGFDDNPALDQNVVAYLEMKRIPYTGCNARGLVLGRDKVIAKKLLSYHRIAVPDFVLIPRGLKARRPKRLRFPLIVKSATLDASVGISQASVVEDDARLAERVHFMHEKIGTDALVESYIDGRELYVGIIGNHRIQAFPVWELDFSKMPEESRRIATERLKWSIGYQRRHGIVTGPARGIPDGAGQRIQRVCKRVYKILRLSGYARIDLRLSDAGKLYVIEANPNPQLAYGEDFAESAERAGVRYDALLQRIASLGLRWAEPGGPG
jgi:D-alanine-D-alanine ligase